MAPDDHRDEEPLTSPVWVWGALSGVLARNTRVDPTRMGVAAVLTMKSEEA